jgi:hypothetical protein
MTLSVIFTLITANTTELVLQSSVIHILRCCLQFGGPAYERGEGIEIIQLQFNHSRDTVLLDGLA